MAFEEPEIRRLIEERNWSALRDRVSGWRVPDIADLIADLDKECRVFLYRALPRAIAADVFSEFETPDQEALLHDLTDEETRHLMENLAPDDRTALLEELPGQATQKLMNLLSPADLAEARRLLGYPEDSIGRLMTPEYVAVRPDWTVGMAMDHIRKVGQESETFNVIYVTDRSWRLLGAVSLRQIVLSDPIVVISSIMTTPAASLSAFHGGNQALRAMEQYGVFILPVVDSGGILVGMVTGDDILELVTEEATEDFHRSAAVTPLRVGFADASISLLYRSRIGWLVTLVFVNLISTTIMSRFDRLISQVVVLVSFLPALIDCGGNAGSQSATLIIRDLATGDAEYKDWRKLLLKEAGIALMLGLTMAIALWGPGFWQGGVNVASVVALSSLAIVAFSSVIGAATPLFLGRLGLDPAASSAPLITSIADIMGVAIYFTLASKFFGL